MTKPYKCAHKLHYSLTGHREVSYCGQIKYVNNYYEKLNFTKEWKEVTCKHCLKIHKSWLNARKYHKKSWY